MNRAVIISGGNISDDFALAFLKKYPGKFLIAADRGLHFCRKNDLLPTHAVGDFDSGEEEDLLWLQNREEIPVRRFRPQKDVTDTQIAVELAIELGAEEIRILGGTGARIDHTFANVRILGLGLEKGIPVLLEDEHNRIYLKREHFFIPREEQFGTYVSFFALGGPVKGLSLEGFYYPLTDYEMDGMDPLGVSNEIKESVGKVYFSSGTLLVIESKD